MRSKNIFIYLQEPQPPAKWTGIRDASNFVQPMPMQKEVFEPFLGAAGSEDCLYLNVYTNEIGHKRPVLFFIYGGGFVEGNGNDWYKEDYFVSTDVVLVSINYRVGPFGKEINNIFAV